MGKATSKAKKTTVKAAGDGPACLPGSTSRPSDDEAILTALREFDGHPQWNVAEVAARVAVLTGRTAPNHDDIVRGNDRLNEIRRGSFYTGVVAWLESEVAWLSDIVRRAEREAASEAKERGDPLDGWLSLDVRADHVNKHLEGLARLADTLRQLIRMYGALPPGDAPGAPS